MLSLRDLNRTLLLRQHLLARTTMSALEMTGHLVGLQAQENLSPYLSLAARIEDFDPYELSTALEGRTAVRLLAMRGTIHVLLADDALALRAWVQPMLDRQSASNQQSRPARGVAVEDCGSSRVALPTRASGTTWVGRRCLSIPRSWSGATFVRSDRAPQRT